MLRRRTTDGQEIAEGGRATEGERTDNFGIGRCFHFSVLTRQGEIRMIPQARLDGRVQENGCYGLLALPFSTIQETSPMILPFSLA